LPGSIPRFPTTGFHKIALLQYHTYADFSIASMVAFSLDLSQNQLTGEIPSNLLQTSSGSCNSLNSLNLSHNFLTGNVPFDSTNCSSLNVLDVSHNNLSGPQPLFSESSALTIVLLGNNQLSGDAVDILIRAAHIGVFQLGLENNLFTGDLSKLISLSPEFSKFVQIVDLSNNYLQWSVSDDIPDPITATLERLHLLVEFRVGSNNFSGTSLPTSCGQNNSFNVNIWEVLDFSDTHLKGNISSSFFNSSCLPHIQILNLSNNDVTGIVPDSIIVLPTLEILDLSSNHLTGHLPLLPTNSNLNNPSFFEGNDGLCGYPLSLC
jgi:Leucine-rich repeat (LRR) protein